MEKSNPPIWIADIETTSLAWKSDEARMYAWGLKSKTNFYYGITWDTFFKKINDEGILCVYFHNLTFDGKFMCHWLLENGYTFINDEEATLKKKQFLWFNDGTSGIYKMQINTYGTTIDFMCSYKLLAAGVEALGKQLKGVKAIEKYLSDVDEGVNKLNIDYNKYKPFNDIKELESETQLLKYLERDCLIPLIHIELLDEQLSKVGRITTRPWTRAGLAMKDFTVWYGEDKFVEDFGGVKYVKKKKIEKWLFNEEEWSDVAHSYNGGYTNSGRDIYNKEYINITGYCYDINSSYPSIMLYEKLPIGPLIYLDINEADLDSNEYVMLYFVNIFEYETKDGYPGFIRSGSSRMDDAKFYTKFDVRKEFTFFKDEWEFIIKYSKNIKYKILRRMAFRQKAVFGGWIIENYNARLKCGENKDELGKLYYKLLMNSLYGKFGQHYEKAHLEIIPVDKYTNEHKLRYGKNKEYTHNTFFKSTNQFRHIGVASRITSLARLKVYKAIVENIDNFLYADTDSVYLKGPAKEGSMDINPNKLGSWKFEKNFTFFKALRAKMYCYGNTINDIVLKTAGLPQSAHHMIIKPTIKETLDFFKVNTLLPKAKKAQHNVWGGILIEMIDFTL